MPFYSISNWEGTKELQPRGTEGDAALGTGTKELELAVLSLQSACRLSALSHSQDRRDAPPP